MGSFTFPDRSARADALEVSRFSCTLLPGVPEVFDYAEPGSCSRIAQLTVLPSRRQKGVGTRLHIFGAQSSLPASSPVYASLWLLAETQARLGAGMKSLLLFRRALSSPTMCRFIPALSDE